jgi:uncharacterized delta-60 repeat protein
MRVALAALILAACHSGGSSPGAPDGGSDNRDASLDGAPAQDAPGVPPGTLIDTSPAPSELRYVLDAASRLYQFDDGVRVGTTGAPLFAGTVLQGQLHGTAAISSQGPLSFCKVDVTTGALDAAFGNHGCTMAANSNYEAIGVVAESDGYRAVVQRFCAGGGCPAADTSFALIKLGADGTLDTTFGNATAPGVRDTAILPDLIGYSCAGQSSGNLIVTAYDDVNGAAKVLRVHPDGALDTAFGTSGFVPGAGGVADLDGVRVLADDSIFLPSTSNARIERYTSGGAPLPGWGTGGRVGLSQVLPSSPHGFITLRAAELDAQGRVVVAYWRKDDATSTGTKYLYVARLLADGTLDTAFGVGGVTALSDDTFLYGIGFEPDGRILFGADDANGHHIVGHLQP